MEKDHDKWNTEGTSKDLPLSPSCSSFEVLDPHDPTISRLATQLFKRTNDYLQGEMAAGQLSNEFDQREKNPLVRLVLPTSNLTTGNNPIKLQPLPRLQDTDDDYYTLLEEINRMAITKYADLRNLASNLSKTLNEYNELYHLLIKPLLVQIDHIDAQVSQFEANAYRLDSYTKQLRARYKELEEK